MKEELKKCEPRCIWCHRLKTKERAKNRKQKKKPEVFQLRSNEINNLKLKIGNCKNCNPIFFNENNAMLLGDAKKSCDNLLAGLKKHNNSSSNNIFATKVPCEQ